MMTPKQPIKPYRFRVCAVCGKRHAHTYGFHHVLHRIGIKGDKAAVVCVQRAQREFDRRST